MERRHLNAYDRALLEFANRWYRFGGGDEYIFTEFGVSIPMFYHRVLSLVESRRTSNLDFDTKQILRKFCTVKLSQFSGSANFNPGADSTTPVACH